ncbi:hypothetical protein NG798_17240 [Ancylothrix sp. C2]|uniref:hypothetical protein n=1 Tax=Ancylothrix sp. D3o TaxID=2953691 RepID=UPI0021BBB30B|nr:hypothetical protein [Ancylothrix sp. D3o]MCT7951551.1 hypothetical protein [Ancylothrix sp. D3o]
MMLFSSQTVSKSQPFDTPPSSGSIPIVEDVPASVLLSLATMPLIVGLWGVKAMGGFLRDLGEASEEVFRGERLPVLHFPQDSPLSDDSASD